jgi:hypothetical protein
VELSLGPYLSSMWALWYQNWWFLGCHVTKEQWPVSGNSAPALLTTSSGCTCFRTRFTGEWIFPGSYLSQEFLCLSAFILYICLYIHY